MSDDLRVDPERIDLDDTTGVYVRAVDDDGHWHSIDINCLDRASLRLFLAGRKRAAEQVVLLILGHAPLSVEEIEGDSE
jgi:hypothetical protein